MLNKYKTAPSLFQNIGGTCAIGARMHVFQALHSMCRINLAALLCSVKAIGSGQTSCTISLLWLENLSRIQQFCRLAKAAVCCQVAVGIMPPSRICLQKSRVDGHLNQSQRGRMLRSCQWTLWHKNCVITSYNSVRYRLQFSERL